MKIEGAGALVAGGASGLGAATSRALAQAGARVVIADLNAEKGEALAAEIGATFVAADVTDAEAVGAAVESAAGAAGGLRVSVCCAGIGWAERVAHKGGPHNLEYFSNVVKVNLIGTFNVLRLAAASMSEQRARRRRRARRLRQHRLDRRLRRPDRPGRLRRLQGRHRRHDPAGGARHGLPRRPRDDDRPRPLRHAAARRPAGGGARPRSAQGIPFPSRLGHPDEYARIVLEIVANPMLNGETIRLDGALRMPPK